MLTSKKTKNSQNVSRETKTAFQESSDLVCFISIDCFMQSIGNAYDWSERIKGIKELTFKVQDETAPYKAVNSCRFDLREYPNAGLEDCVIAVSKQFSDYNGRRTALKEGQYTLKGVLRENVTQGVILENCNCVFEVHHCTWKQPAAATSDPE